MTEKIEMATVSTRGQVCIPNDIREEMGLEEGSKVLFVLSGDSLIVKKVNMKTFEEITKPLREAKKKIREDEVTDLIHRFREKQRAKNEGSS
ncbi:MAG: AbrB/MazE/SpoVT family DNA-binding domain-containing protein [Candidatus Pacearchaeota archaeon]|jgi:AbrB family looped-hinge helix DNA binding protein